MARYETVLAATLQDGVSPVASQIVASMGQIRSSIDQVNAVAAQNKRDIEAWSEALKNATPGSEEWIEASQRLGVLRGEAEQLARTKLEMQSNLPQKSLESLDLVAAFEEVAAQSADTAEALRDLNEEYGKLLAANEQAVQQLEHVEPGTEEWHALQRTIDETATRLDELGEYRSRLDLDADAAIEEMRGLADASDLVKGSVGEATEGMTSFKAVLMGIGVGIGIGVFNALADAAQKLAGILPNLNRQGQEFAKVVDDLRDVSGASVEDVSQLVGVFQYLGISAGSLTSILPRLASGIERSASKWEDLGISLYNADGSIKTSIQLLDELRQKVGAVANTPGGAAVLDDLLGGRQSWAQMLDYLQMSDQQMAMLTGRVDQLNVSLSETELSMVEVASRAQNELGLAIQGLANVIAVSIAPIITDTISLISEWIRQNATAIQTFVQQVAGFILGLIESILNAIGVVTNFSTAFAEVGNTVRQVDDSYLKYVRTRAAEERQSNRSSAASVAGSRRQLDAARELDAQQERIFRREIARINGVLAKQLEALDKAEQRQDQARTRQDLQERLRTAQTRVAAGFDPTAADELKDAQQELADFEADVARDAQRQRIGDTQETINQIINAEATAATTTEALKRVAGYRERAEKRRLEALRKGDLAEARRQELVIETADATRRRIIQKQTNDAMIKGLQATTGAAQTATRTQAHFWQDLERKLERERKKAVVGNAAMNGAIIGGVGKVGNAFAGAKGSLTAKMEEARRFGVQIGTDIATAMGKIATTIETKLVPALEDIGDLLLTIGGMADQIGSLFASEPYKNAMAAWERKWLATKANAGTMGRGSRENSGTLGNQAEGGPVQAGGAYVVGERGPELLLMGNQSGRIIPNNQLGAPAGVPVVIPIQIDGREIARVADRHLYWMTQTAPVSRRG